MMTTTTITQDNQLIGRWTLEEHNKFLEGLDLFGSDWKKMADFIGSRNNVQCRTHAQKYFKRLNNAKKKLLKKLSLQQTMIAEASEESDKDSDKEEPPKRDKPLNLPFLSRVSVSSGPSPLHSAASSKLPSLSNSPYGSPIISPTSGVPPNFFSSMKLEPKISIPKIISSSSTTKPNFDPSKDGCSFGALSFRNLQRVCSSELVLSRIPDSTYTPRSNSSFNSTPRTPNFCSTPSSFSSFPNFFLGNPYITPKQSAHIPAFTFPTTPRSTLGSGLLGGKLEKM